MKKGDKVAYINNGKLVSCTIKRIIEDVSGLAFYEVSTTKKWYFAEELVPLPLDKKYRKGESE